MRDEQLRRSFSESDINDEWMKRGSVNKLNGEREVMYKCPECDHRAFALSPSSGWFHCWACGIWGQTKEGEAESRKRWEETRPPLSPLKGEARITSTMSKTPPNQSGRTSHPPLRGNEGVSIIEDYVQLDEEVLEDIEDISLETNVTGAQLAVRNYLRLQQIPLDWARKMHWGVAQYSIKLKDEEKGKLRPCLVYRNYVEGICCNAKFRCVSTKTINKVTRQGQIQRTVTEKGFAQESSFTPCAPYNIDCIRPSQPPLKGGEESSLYKGERGGLLIVTEGEKDCLTLRMLGFQHVIAAANGAQTDHAKSFEAFKDWLAPIDTVVICGDMDKPGRSMVTALIAYFDTSVVKVCHWDQRYYGKDISDVRLRCGEDVARDFVLAAQPITREDIEDFTSADAREAAYQSAIGNYDHGYSVGMGKMTDQVFRLNNLGGLVVVTGVPGTGKTDFLNCLTMSLLRERNGHICYCSFETPDKYRHAGDLARVWAGPTDLSTMSREDVMPFSDFISSHITHIRMRRDRPTPAAVIRKAESVLAMHPTMEYLVIDPYLYLSLPLSRGTSQTDAIKDMLTEIQDWAHNHRVWVFLVAHPRMLHKEDSGEEFEEVTFYTISGSANWANVADFIFSLKRVKKTNCDYTKMNVLKVRDQKLCHPGEVFYKRQDCGRYDECASETEAITGTVINQDVMPWPIS